MSETVTENIFRKFYGAETFIEKSAIPAKYGFKSKEGTEYKGYPDFFKDLEDYVIIVEAKATDIKKAEKEVTHYMKVNNITKNKLGIAIAGQTSEDIKIKYLYEKDKKICEFEFRDCFKKINILGIELEKALYGDDISDEELSKILISLNKKFHNNHIRDTERSLFFSGLIIALTNTNFRSIYKSLVAPSKEEQEESKQKLNESHNLNYEIIRAIEKQLKGKINSLSKEFSWLDRFSFIKTVDIPLDTYKEIIETIETKIYIPFKKNEKLDILGRAYKIFLSRAGKIDSKNIIITPDHIKSLMIRLARLSKDDVILDTCTGTGGFLMEAMEEMIKLCKGDEKKIKHIKEKQLIGFEIDPVLFSLACTNMFLHGDGRTNMIYRSSLLSNSKEDKDFEKSIKKFKPTKIIINPPYEKGNPIKFTEQAIEYLEVNGKLIIIMPSVTLDYNEENFKKILKKAKLDFIIKLPKQIFKDQKRDVYTSIFGFTKTPHCKTDEVLFCELESDGLVSVQHKGRVDKNNKWKEIEDRIVDCVNNSKEIKDFSEKRKIYYNNELISYGVRKEILKNKKLVKFSELFDTSEKGRLDSEKNNSKGEYDFITCSESWKKHDKFQAEKEAIIYAVASEGSLGRAHYVNGKFMASTLCVILTPKNEEKYPIDLEFYTYYLMSIKKKIANDLGEGTSKKTIKVDKLDNYYIEYIPYDKQIELKKEIQKREEKLKDMEKKLIEYKDNFYNGISNI